MAKDIDKEMTKSIGIKLMLARDNAGLTREELSEKADVEANSIYRYETGKQVPNFPTMIRLAKGIGVSVADLVPDDYIAKTEDDLEGVVEWFYQMDKQDQQVMLRQITSIFCGTFHTIGLKSDGTVIAIGRDGFGQCDLDSWNHITAVAAGYNHSVGLTKEKRVVCKGSNEYGQCNTQEWCNVIAIAAAGDHTIGLTENGTVLATGDIQSFRFDKWSDVMSIATGTYHVVGLKKDGTVIATGHNANGQCDVYRWYDIAQVYAGFFKTVAIRSDGHVLSTTSEHELDRTHPDTSTWRLFESKGNLERKSKFESVKSQFREMLLNIKQKAVECMPLINNRGMPGGEFVLEHTREFDKSIEYLWKESKRSWELYREIEPLPPISDLMIQYNASFSDFFNSLKIEKTSEDTEAIPRFFPTENTYSTFVEYYTQIGQIERQLNLMV